MSEAIIAGVASMGGSMVGVVSMGSGLADIASGATVEAANETAAVDEASARAETATTMKSLVKAYLKGEREYRRGTLEAGRLCHVYLVQRLKLGDKRESGVDTIKGQLSAYASVPVDVNRLIGSYQAWRLLAEEAGLEEGAANLPIDRLRDSYSRLVTRINKDTATESYVLLPGLEDECRKLFATATEHAMDAENVRGKVSELVRRHTAIEQAATNKTAVDAREKMAMVANAAASARSEREAAAQEAKDAAAAAAKAKDEGNVEQAKTLGNAANAAAEVLLAKQRDEIAANAAAAEQSRKQAAAEKERKAAEKRAKNQSEKDRRAADKALENQGNRPIASTEARQGQNYLAVGKAGTAKDVAANIVELLTGCDEPDTVLGAVLDLLDGHKDLGMASKKAVKAARYSLQNSHSKPLQAPVAVPA